MSEGRLVKDLGGLAEPATALVNRVWETMGGFFRPYQMRRVAQAEADVAIVQAQSEIEVTDLHRRAMKRFLGEEARRQENIESITDQALPLLESGARPDAVDEDWIVNFFDKSRVVGDAEMQALWAKVLAGEANSPGTYSRRTVNLLANMNQRDALMFRYLRQFCLRVDDLDANPFIHDYRHAFYNDRGVSFSSLSHLDAAGLLHFQNGHNSWYSFDFDEPPVIQGDGFRMQLSKAGGAPGSVPFGHVLLTQAGMELARICPAPTPEGFLDLLVERFGRQGLSLTPLEPTSPTSQA